MKRVSNENCANDPAHFVQENKCKLQDCPQDGNWSNWSHWGPCSQNCVHHPRTYRAEDVKTKAIRRKERFCSNPMPRFGGRKCVKVPKGYANDVIYRFKSEQYSEQLEGPCITELTKTHEKRNALDQIVPWCPEHCVYSEWGNWSPCTHTCIPMKIYSNYEKGVTYGDEVSYKVTMQSQGFESTRQRIRVMKRPERFNGECEERKRLYDNPGTFNGTVIIDRQTCALCPEHCPPHAAYSFKLLEYPGRDPTCIGYCPVDCVIDRQPAGACEERLHKYFKEELPKVRKQFQSDKTVKVSIAQGDCFISKAYAHIVSQKWTTEAEMMPAFLAKFAQAKDASVFDTKPNLPFKRPHRVPQSIWNNVVQGWENDFYKLKDLVTQITSYAARGPNVDGLAGGKHCVNTQSNEKITSHTAKITEKGYTRYTYWDESKPVCHIDICRITYSLPGTTLPELPCMHFRWTEWGEWGACAKGRCGELRHKKRTRVCQNTCEHQKVDDGKCKPIVDKERGKKWTNEHTAICDPCPPEKTLGWAGWGQWSREGWSQQEACQKGLKEIKWKRERYCTGPGKLNKGCPKGISGVTEGADVEYRTIPLPKDCGADYDKRTYPRPEHTTQQPHRPEPTPVYPKRTTTLDPNYVDALNNL